MDRQTAVLIVSEQGSELQKTIQMDVKWAGLVVDLLPEETHLFTYLAQHFCTLLVIDLASLQELSSLAPFFTQMRNCSPYTAVMLLATQEERNLAAKQLQQGAADYMLLPINEVELAVRVERLLANHSLNQNGFYGTQGHSKADELSLLDEATQEIIQTLQLDIVLDIVVSRARQISQADLAKIYLADKTGELNKGNVFRKTSLADDHNEDEELLLGFAQEAALTQKIIAQQEASSYERSGQQSRTMLFVPMLSREKLIGVLALSRSRPAAFSTYHTRWLSVFCAQAAIAIENARLFQDLSSAYIDLAQSREQILRSRNTLQVIFDGISDGLYILDKDLTINTLNRIEAERQGYRPDELMEQSFLSLAWTKAAPDLLQQIRTSLKTGRETTWISAEDESEPYLKDREFRIYPIRNRIAQIEQLVVFAQDVSERRRWQASLFRSANLAAVGQLAGSVAHQINNPLTVTMTNSQLLMLDTDPASEMHELASGILKAGERIQNIVTNLLEFSNQERYFFVQTDLIETIEGALALVIRSLKKAHIELVKDYRVQPMISASISHLKLVWINLLLNARDAVTDHAGQPQIIISTQAVSEREVKVAITDNGVGLTEKAMEQLFRPFFTTKPIGKALGLGLYSAYAIVERHQGTIKAFSQPGVATTFEVILPLDNPRDL